MIISCWTSQFLRLFLPIAGLTIWKGLNHFLKRTISKKKTQSLSHYFISLFYLTAEKGLTYQVIFQIYLTCAHLIGTHGLISTAWVSTCTLPLTVLGHRDTWPPVLLTRKIRIWPMTWYPPVEITCNCTRPPVERPDHRRRLILAPKPSSALLYNTPTPLSTLCTKLYTTSTQSLLYCVLPILDLAHTTQDALLYSSFTCTAASLLYAGRGWA